jgi:hypothetical protein
MAPEGFAQDEAHDVSSIGHGTVRSRVRGV